VSSFALVITGTPAINVLNVDMHHVYVGNTAAIIRAGDTRLVDTNHDGRLDLAAVFTSLDAGILPSFRVRRIWPRSAWKTAKSNAQSPIQRTAPSVLHFAPDERRQLPWCAETSTAWATPSCTADVSRAEPGIDPRSELPCHT
jgi:hypothetical protein